MPKKEKVLIGVLIGIIIILAGIFSYAYAKKIWFFSKADVDGIYCGDIFINVARLEQQLPYTKELGASGGMCSAQVKTIHYDLYSDKKGSCIIKMTPSQDSAMWVTDPKCEFKENHNSSSEVTLKINQIREGGGDYSFDYNYKYDANSLNEVGNGFISDAIYNQYQKYQSQARANKDKCCPKVVPTATLSPVASPPASSNSGTTNQTTP